ncbi:OsmC family protein [Flindersiella endophytica]
MGASHQYDIAIEWQGNRGSGTTGYRDYGREHEVRAAGKPALAGSSDKTFRGDASRWNPEELLVTALAQCHMLAYLHLCVEAGVVVVGYEDSAVGTMVQDDEGWGGQFTRVVLRPVVTVASQSMVEQAHALHEKVGAVCFIARSVNFPVDHEPRVKVE